MLPLVLIFTSIYSQITIDDFDFSGLQTEEDYSESISGMEIKYNFRKTPTTTSCGISDCIAIATSQLVPTTCFCYGYLSTEQYTILENGIRFIYSAQDSSRTFNLTLLCSEDDGIQTVLGSSELQVEWKKPQGCAVPKDDQSSTESSSESAPEPTPEQTPAQPSSPAPHTQASESETKKEESSTFFTAAVIIGSVILLLTVILIILMIILIVLLCGRKKQQDKVEMEADRQPLKENEPTQLHEPLLSGQTE